MSARPTDPDSGFAALQEQGYEVEVRQQHMLVHSVPYVTVNRTVERATVVCKYVENAGTILPPTPAAGDDHQIWWTGSFPCRSDGAPMLSELVANAQPTPFTVFDGCDSQHRFSNKPEEYNQTGYPDHFEKVTHYVTLIQSQAKMIDPSADARTRRVIAPSEPDSVFRYADTASVRAKGRARTIICGYLAAQGIPFVDVGMDVVMDADTQQLDGTCRVTTVTQLKNDHIVGSIPMDEDESDALYRQNIQVADLNALNAQLAVIKWKQLFGFYEDRARSHQTTFTVATQSLTRGELAASNQALKLVFDGANPGTATVGAEAPG